MTYKLELHLLDDDTGETLQRGVFRFDDEDVALGALENAIDGVLDDGGEDENEDDEASDL